MSSAICFNLDQSKILSLGKKLRSRGGGDVSNARYNIKYGGDKNKIRKQKKNNDYEKNVIIHLRAGN